MRSIDDIMETVRVMLHQETEYAVTELPYPMALPTTVDFEARAKMVEWCGRVVDYCKLETETVCIAMNYTDRMCMKDPSILTSRSSYQLVAMTALYTAAKIHAPEAMDPKLVSNLSRGTYTVFEIEEQERRLVSMLQWRLNPPTAHSFVRQFAELFSPVLHPREQQAATLFALQQIDVFVHKDQCSTTVPASVIAYCAIMNALGYIRHTSSPRKQVAAAVGCNLADIIFVDPTSCREMVSETRRCMVVAIQELEKDEMSPIRHGKRVRVSTPSNETTMERRQSPRLVSDR